MDYEKVSYPEAIEKIAAITNFSLDYEDKNYEPKKPVVVVTPKVKEEKKVKKFIPSLKRDADLKKGFKNYVSLPLKFKMMPIVTGKLSTLS